MNTVIKNAKSSVGIQLDPLLNENTEEDEEESQLHLTVLNMVDWQLECLN